MKEILSASCVEIQGNKRVVIEGCSSMLDFSDEEIIVISKRLKISVKGKTLKIVFLAEQVAVIKGEIQSVNFDYM